MASGNEYSGPPRYSALEGCTWPSKATVDQFQRVLHLGPAKESVVMRVRGEATFGCSTDHMWTSTVLLDAPTTALSTNGAGTGFGDSLDGLDVGSDACGLWVRKVEGLAGIPRVPRDLVEETGLESTLLAGDSVGK